MCNFADVIKIYERFYTSPDAEFVAKVNQFEPRVELLNVDGTEHALVHRPVLLKDSESCQQVQIGIT
jgi:hypothetical protein